MKKLIIIVMVFAMVIALPTYGLNQPEVLNKLGVLQGDGESYLLESNLTRAQALTFVIRILGEESFIQKADRQLRMIGFSDTNKDAWYAPYVGYGKHYGLVEGYPDGTFKPDQELNEWEFYAMLLNALEIDFEWETVESKALENNLILTSNSNNTIDYKRGNVVEVLFTTLSNRPNLIENLLDDSTITMEELYQSGIYGEDEVETDIESVESISKTKTIVDLNEEIVSAEVSIDDITIESISINEDQLTITHNPIEEKDYIVVLEAIKDVLGFTVEKIERTFTGYIPEVVESNYFYISKIEPISKKQINISFTQPITLGAELELHYDIYENGDLWVEGDFDTLELKKQSDTDNTVALWVNDKTFDSNKQYEIEIKDSLKSSYGATLESDSAKFYGSDESISKLKLLEIKAVGNDFIRVTFNKDISESSLDNKNFSLEEIDTGVINNAVSDAVFTGAKDLKYRQIDIRFPWVDDGETYEITFNDIKDAFDATEVDDRKIQFLANDEESEIELKAGIAQNQNIVNLYFSEPIKKESINGIFLGLSIDSVLFMESNPTLLQLFLDTSLNPNGEYDLEILSNSIVRLNGSENSDSIEYTIDGTELEMPDIDFSTLKFVADNLVYIEFNVPVSTSSITESDFKLSYKDDGSTEYEYPKSIKFVNEKEAVLRFEKLDTSDTYRLIGENLKDFSEQFNTNKVERRVKR